jgi:hypothetical protein
MPVMPKCARRSTVSLNEPSVQSSGVEDIEAIHDYIEQYDALAAKRVVRRLKAQSDALHFFRYPAGLGWFPERGFSWFRDFRMSQFIACAMKQSI